MDGNLSQCVEMVLGETDDMVKIFYFYILALMCPELVNVVLVQTPSHRKILQLNEKYLSFSLQYPFTHEHFCIPKVCDNAQFLCAILWLY